MSFQNFFQSVPSIDPQEVRELITPKSDQGFVLLDVRQPMENAQVRLPGSVLIPLGELNQRFTELDPSMRVIVYCQSGNRSVSATNFLLGQGFNEVQNMTGGIVSYNGMVASGPPQAAAACFDATLSPHQLAATAWLLEDGTIRFLEQVFHAVLNDHEPALLDHILQAKRRHRESLQKLVGDMARQAVADDFPRGIIDVPEDPIMIGCIKISDALGWVADKALKDLLEMLMTLSANTYDFYLRLGQAAGGDEEKRVFQLLESEEHQHLERLASAYERELSAR